MSVEEEFGELDHKLASVSPTVQSDTSTDGDGTTQNTATSSDKFSISQDAPLNCEPKAKKRRKQSNPLKIQNAPPSPKFDLSAYDMADQSEPENNPTIPFDFEEGLLTENDTNEKNRPNEHTSQKGSLSRVTNALFNSKVKEAAKLSSKSKESSLQSLTDISSPESGEDGVSNNEYKNAMQNVYQHMPGLLPVNPIDVANDATKLSNMYNFPDFPSPIQQGNVNLSVSQRSFVTSSGVRVFNPEAYCELCEKEFCNKYFLKTHKANKHGICSNDNSPSSYGGYRVAYKNMPMNPQAAQQMISQMCETGATFGSADSYCNICQKYFCNKYFLKKHRQNIHGIFDETSPIIPSSIHVPVISSPLPLIRSMSNESKSAENLSGNGTKDEDSKVNVSLENIKNSLNSNLPLVNGSSPQTPQIKNVFSINQKEKKNEQFLCELCNIEFCEKCFLDAHMANKHGSTKVLSTEIPDFSEVGKTEMNVNVCSDEVEESKEFKGQMCTPCNRNFTSSESFQNHMLEIHNASLKEDDDISRDVIKRNGQNVENGNITSFERSSLQEMDGSNNSNDSVTYNCNLCPQKCKDKKSFLTHAESEHGIVGSAAIEASNLSCDACSEQFPDHIALMSHKFNIHGIIPTGLETRVDNGENGEYIHYQGLRQKGGGSSFCQICNKELCNKYFMKTHMLKMHGIDVDKAQIERWSAPSTGGVYCDICQKFLCSKYFLKVHKQNVHGITDDSPKIPMPNESPSYCNNFPVNDKKIEKLSVNLSQTDKVNNIIKEILPVNGDITKRSNGNVFACDICGQVFYDKVMLQCHLVDKHVKCNDSKSFPNSYSQFEDSKEALQAGILPCPCCSYVNLDDNSKLSHVNSLEVVKVISCILCNVTYHQNDYHTHHLSHGTSLPAGKKVHAFENGFHDDLGNGFNLSGNNEDSNKNSVRPKLKRFRCSKCDKTFRTKMKCLHHIQVMHKIKKGLSNPCDSQNPSKKITTNHINLKRNVDHKTSGPENGTSSICTKEANDRAALVSSGLPEGAPLPVPYILPNNSDVIMQPFHLAEPKSDETTKQNIFVPSVVFLPVSQKVSEKLTVAFTLTPA